MPRAKRKIVVAGIDGTGKTTLLESLVERLDGSYRVLRVGTSAIQESIDGRRVPLVPEAWDRRVESLRRTSKTLHLYGVFLVFHFVYKYLLSRYFQRTHDCELVVFGRDTLLHPPVYLALHFPRAARLLPRALRFRIFSALFGSPRGALVFYLETSPETSAERVRRREEASGEAVQAHENPKDLARLKAEFESMLEVASARGYEIVRIDTSGRGPGQVADVAEAALRARLGASEGGSAQPRAVAASGES